jgi:hypothetical protein
MVERLFPRALAAGMAIALLAASPSTSIAAPRTTAWDDDPRTVSFVGPAEDINPLIGGYQQWRLRSRVNTSSHRVMHQLYVETNTFDRRGWNSAWDEGARRRRVVRIASSAPGCRRKRGGGRHRRVDDDLVCRYDETVGVTLDDAFVRANASGFRIEMTARSGDDLTLDVSAAQIAPVLSAIDAYLQRGGDSASSGAPNDLKSAPRRNGGAER